MDNRSKALKEIFEEHPNSLHIRLLARKTGLNQNTIVNITDKLAQEGIITKEKDKETNKVSIKGNTHNQMFLLQRKFYNIKKIYESGLIEHLNDKLHYPTIILFGSYAKAENTKNSDIDIFIICDEKIKLDLSEYYDKLGAEIQLFIHTKKEFDTLKKTNKELMNNVINGSILSGFVEAF